MGAGGLAKHIADCHVDVEIIASRNILQAPLDFDFNVDKYPNNNPNKTNNPNDPNNPNNIND